MNQVKLFVGCALLTAGACLAQPEPPRPPRTPQGFVFQTGASSYLGVGVSEIDSERTKQLKLKEEHGVEVTSVADDGPATKAGLKVGDVVLEYNGQRVEGIQQFIRFVQETPVGRTVKLLISRNGATQTLTPTIASRGTGPFFSTNGDNLEGFKALPFPDMPRPLISMQNRMLGVESESLGSQLAEYFGVKEGVLVRSVIRGSAAEKAGIKAGDVITKVGDRKVSNPNEIANALRSASGGTVPVTVMRNQKEMTVTVTVENRSGQRIRRSLVRMDGKIL